ncbi:MAG: 50S ribosomal protein L11 methyltransferase [Selenomonadaceae bacterium]|nr:50S ribosomal protein L11 methyltransferase [Selenomonadaceae bacterium]
MNWAEISVRTSHEATDVVAEIYHELGAAGVVIEDPRLLNSYIEAGIFDYSALTKAEDTEVVTVKAYLPMDKELPGKLQAFECRVEKILREGHIPGGPGTVSWSEVHEEDWADSWKQYFHPTKVGGLIVIKPAWEEYTAAPDDIVIELDPKSAFGSGTHPTTALCIRELESLVKGGMTVFDLGTGSGVLAITAAKLSAASVVAVDTDPAAIEAAQENVKRNGLGNITVQSGDLLRNVTGEADIIVANIIADVIMELLPTTGAHLKPQGVLLASGIITERVSDVTQAALKNNFCVRRVVEEEGWAAMVIGREP